MRVIQTLAVAASVAAAVLSAACSKPAPPPEPVRAVRTIELRAGDGAPSIDYAAEIRARTETRLSFRVGGKLVERRVDLGDRVRAGQPVARLDPQDLRLGQDNARAALAAAEASLELAQADFRRYRDLRDQGFISFAELERRETTLKSAQAQQRQAQAQAAVQANQASYASLVADAAGVVTGIDAEPGAVLAAGAPVLRLALDGPRDVVFAVPEDKVEQLRRAAAQPGALQVLPWGQGATPLPATLREIAAAADPVTRTFLAKADLGAAANAAVRLGQTATVRLRLPATGAALRLPLAALKEEQGRSIVWLVDRASMTVRAQPVQLGGADGNEVIVASGLQPGQWVVTAGVHVLRPGQKVTLYGAAPAGAASAAAAPGTASSGAGR
ncbi:efflux RND transporter periplasmic adaptor subunit [Piscinibacter sakaiensis]|uniref:Putative Co/Zn/Cd efflux system membrane fusion protein n=1 Tax=Piscinibacter sakaiensis TaxID=1547922 RepID=A0A0K8NZ58_PISS1|nr:efflux RND transporter periplasmic adaptor subunit [Piscinibacter sakaiensis]GAP35599.1 putative Co/Zn/Cd efflux system membrane fusion protein [Piscinibacter sakaiensis]